MNRSKASIIHIVSPIVLGLLLLCVVWLLVQESRKVRLRRASSQKNSAAPAYAPADRGNQPPNRSNPAQAVSAARQAFEPPQEQPRHESAFEWVPPKSPERPIPVAERPVRLSDGREVAFGGVTYGLEHAYMRDKPAPNLATVPAERRQEHALHTITIKTPTPSLVVWLHCRAANGSLLQGDFISIVDSGGIEGELSKASAIFNAAESETVGAWEVSNFPRRDAMFRVRLYSRDSSNRVHRMAEFRAGNPAPREYPAFTAEPLPIIRKSENVEYRLLSIVRDESRTALALRTGDDDSRAPWTTCTFQVLAPGQSAAEWKVDSLAFSDATGNLCLPDNTHFSRVSGYLAFSANRVFWSSESSGKVRAEFTRVSGFQTNELIMFTGLRVPSGNRRLSIHLEQRWEDIALHLEELISHAPPVLMDNAYWNMELTAGIVPDLPGVHFSLAGLIDRSGRALAPGVSHKLPKGRQSFLFQVPAGADVVQVTFALQRSHVVEFIPPLQNEQPPLSTRRSTAIQQAGLPGRSPIYAPLPR